MKVKKTHFVEPCIIVSFSEFIGQSKITHFSVNVFTVLNLSFVIRDV